jgi:hypothetical protein
MEAPQPSTVVAIVRDLIFSSKITGTAKALGVAVRMIRDPAQLGDEPARLLLVDLSLPGVIQAVLQWRQTHPVTAVGFVSHVDTPTIDSAREAGITVMARSGFVEALPKLLQDANQ